MIVGSRIPRCLILLASHNGANYIGQQLESIIRQRNVAVQILIGDDASCDATLDIIQSLNTSGNIRVQRRQVGSGRAAQNFAKLFREADITGFDYVALSDQDDIWLPDKLERAIDTLVARDAGGYSCSVIAHWSDGRKSIFCQSARLRAADFMFEGAGQGCTFVITAALFESTQKLFRARPDLTARLIYHDWAIYALARVLGVAWVFDAEPFLIYRQHDGNDTGARSSVAGIRRRLRLLSDGRYRGQVSAINRLCLEVAPQCRLPRRWMELDATAPGIAQRLGKAAFCFLYGRRRQMDRILTAVAALAGWL